MNFDVLEHQEASSQLSFIYRTFRISPPQLSIISAAKEMPAEYAPLLQSFGKIGLKVISCHHGQTILLPKQFVISRAIGFDYFFEHVPNLSISNASSLLSCSSTIKANQAQEIIKMWIKDRQKIVISGRSLCGKSTTITRALSEFTQSGSTVQRFFWDGIVAISGDIGPHQLECVQFEILNKFYSNSNGGSNSIAWIECPDFSYFPNMQLAKFNMVPLIIETQCISNLDPASLCAYCHYFLAEDEVFNASDVLFEGIRIEVNECLVRKSSAQKNTIIKRVHLFFMESLKFVFQHCLFLHKLEFSDMHLVQNFLVLVKNCSLQMNEARCSTFGPFWWKKYNLCSETAFYHMSVFCTIWSVGSCLS